MASHKKIAVSVFGNEILGDDGKLPRLLPSLRTAFPNISFIHQDPTEDLTIPETEWFILDFAQGISRVEVFHSLDKFTTTRSLTVHDYDLYTELHLLQKLGKLPKLRIIAIPKDESDRQILAALARILERYI